MKKKFSALQKDIEDQREEIRTMFAHKKELYQVQQPTLLSVVSPTASYVFPASPLCCKCITKISYDVLAGTTQKGSALCCAV